MRTWAPPWIWQRWLLSRGYRYIISRAFKQTAGITPHHYLMQKQVERPKACWLTRISGCRRLHALQVSPTKAIWRVTSAKCLASRPDSFAGRTASGRARSLGDRMPETTPIRQQVYAGTTGTFCLRNARNSCSLVFRCALTSLGGVSASH